MKRDAWKLGLCVAQLNGALSRQPGIWKSKFAPDGSRFLPVILASLCIFVLVPQCQAEGMITITFDGPPLQPPNSSYSVKNYSERGTHFSADLFSRAGSGSTNWPDNGTAYIKPAWTPVTCSRLDNLTFSLVSVDLAGYSSVVPDYTASFEGHRSDGSIVTTNFAVSGLAFQTYSFHPEFSDLTNLLVTAGALDNLKMQLPTIQPVLSISSGRYYPQEAPWIVLRAQGTLGLNYRLEYSDGFPATNWNALSDFESSFFQIEYVSTNIPSQRFFRAVELP